MGHGRADPVSALASPRRGHLARGGAHRLQGGVYPPCREADAPAGNPADPGPSLPRAGPDRRGTCRRPSRELDVPGRGTGRRPGTERGGRHHVAGRRYRHHRVLGRVGPCTTTPIAGCATFGWRTATAGAGLPMGRASPSRGCPPCIGPSACGWRKSPGG